MKSRNFVIGVDGGGTKTMAAVADEKGRVAERKEGGPTNYHSTGETVAKNNLRKLLSPFLRRYRVRKIVFGFAGLDSEKDRAVFKRIVKGIPPRNMPFSLYNDAEIALEAMQCRTPKVLVIAGTGSTMWGQRGGKKAKAGGLDFLLSDEGSAYYLGIRALLAAVRSFDGRGRKTILEGLILKKTRSKNIPDAAARIYLELHRRPGDFKTYIASFAPLVGIAFGNKDAVARSILEESADELFLGVRAVSEKLKFANTNLCVGYVGSAFRAPLLKKLLSAKIKKLAPKAHFIGPVDPVSGAVKMALEDRKDG